MKNKASSSQVEEESKREKNKGKCLQPEFVGMLSFHSIKIELKKSRRAKILDPVIGGYVDRGILGIKIEKLSIPCPLSQEQVLPPTIIIDSLHNREISDLRPNEELEEVIINVNYYEQKVKVGLEIHPKERKILIEYLRKNSDVFA